VLFKRLLLDVYEFYCIITSSNKTQALNHITPILEYYKKCIL